MVWVQGCLGSKNRDSDKITADLRKILVRGRLLPSVERKEEHCWPDGTTLYAALCVFRSLISFQPGRWIGEGGLLRFVGFFRYRTEHRLEFESGRGKLENVD